MVDRPFFLTTTIILDGGNIMKKRLNFYLNMGVENLIRDGSLVPVLFIHKGEMVDICMLCLTNQEISLQFLAALRQKSNADEIYLMGEAFYSKDLSGVRPSKASDRKEAIIVHGFDFKGKTGALIQPFNRDKKGKIFLKKKFFPDQFFPIGSYR
jgi:hypothetical protein